jgi:hypothetical protein
MVEALADITSNAYLLMQGARQRAQEALLGAINNHADGATLRHALDALRYRLAQTRAGSRRCGWLESSYRCIDELTKGPLGDALNATNGRTIESLLRMPVVF